MTRFAFILIYLSVFNLLLFNLTPELIALEFAILVLLFQKKRFQEFLRAWLPFISLFIIYEFLREHADNLSPSYPHTLYWISNLETSLFHTLPTTTLQQHLQTHPFLLNLYIPSYFSFFFYSFLVAYLIWRINEKLFHLYTKQFLILTFLGLAFFFLIPTAPPWFVDQYHHPLHLVRALTQAHPQTAVHISSFSFYQRFFLGNPVAAFPSLHVAWPAFTSLFLILHYRSAKWTLLLLGIPLMVSLSVVALGEHFVLDVLAGWLLALIVIFLW